MNRLRHLNYDFWILLITIIFADIVMAIAFHKCFPAPQSMVVWMYFKVINLAINATVGPQSFFGVIALSLNIVCLGHLISNRQRYKYFKDHTPPEAL